MGRRKVSQDLTWLSLIPDAPTVRPTIDEFRDFDTLMERVVKIGRAAGIVRLVHPEGTRSPEVANRLQDIQFSCRQQVMKVINWKEPSKAWIFDDDKTWNLREFKIRAKQKYEKFMGTTETMQPKQVEVKYWQEMLNSKTDWVEYGNDTEGSAFEEFSEEASDPLARTFWNLRVLAKHDSSVLRRVDALPGITSPFLYIGMWGSTFAWHVEDYYLYSINYQHLGAAKTWYGVPASGADKLEEVVMSHLQDAAKPGTYKSRDQLREHAVKLLIGKATMFSPKLLVDAGVPVYRAYQEPGDFILTFPRAYHGGFGTGFNVGEAVNFALRDWFPFGIDCALRYNWLRLANIISVQELLVTEVVSMGSLMQQGQAKHPKPADLKLLYAFVKQMRLTNAQVGRLRQRCPIHDIVLLPNGTGRTLDCSYCQGGCFLLTVQGVNGLSMCIHCAMSRLLDFENLKVVVMCHSCLPDLEEFAKIAEEMLQQREGADVKSLPDEGLTETQSVLPPIQRIPGPECHYDWHSVFPMTCGLDMQRAADDLKFKLMLAARKERQVALRTHGPAVVDEPGHSKAPTDVMEGPRAQDFFGCLSSHVKNVQLLKEGCGTHEAAVRSGVPVVTRTSEKGYKTEVSQENVAEASAQKELLYQTFSRQSRKRPASPSDSFTPQIVGSQLFPCRRSQSRLF
eukprot:jgi/Botrbrau1/17378/Bobra.0494s0003.2